MKQHPPGNNRTFQAYNLGLLKARLALWLQMAEAERQNRA